MIFASGGKSYPLTGSDGSGYKIAENGGHTIIPPKKPSLIPIVTKEKWPSEAMGLSLKNVRLSVIDKKRYSPTSARCFYAFRHKRTDSAFGFGT